MHRRLLAWFDRHKRDLPWRRTRDPYRIWLSEMMLQQTQVATVLPYYERFLAAFPSVRDLAASGLDDVLRRWAGLGYYARARNLHRAAKLVVEELGGEFPDTCEGLRMLPGIGPYSAAAIASIAFDRRAAVVDGNVTRVIARYFDVRSDVASANTKQRINKLADALAPRCRCGDFNQAMMELGATICLPGASARCDACPLRHDCKARDAKSVARLPIKRRRTRVTAERHVVAAVQRGRRWLVVQRPTDGLWGGLWELPTAVINGEAPAREAKQLARQWSIRLGSIQPVPFCRLERQLSHRRIEFVGYRFHEVASEELPRNRRTPRKEKARWLTMRQLRALPMSTAMRSVVAKLESGMSRAD